MTESNKGLGNIENSRSDEQIAHMQKTVGEGKCPFCDGKGFDPVLNKVIYDGAYWRAWFNPFPYTGTSKHVVIATRSHIVSVQDLSPQAWTEWGELNQHLIGKYNLPGGGLIMRFGDNKLNGGTLNHVHSHIQVPDEKWFCIAVFYKDQPMTAFLNDAIARDKALKAAAQVKEK